MKRNPQADVMRGQALAIDPDWSPTRADRQAANLARQDHPEVARLARRLADERMELHPDAWMWYVGWAGQNIGEVAAGLRREQKTARMADITRKLKL